MPIPRHFDRKRPPDESPHTRSDLLPHNALSWPLETQNEETGNFAANRLASDLFMDHGNQHSQCEGQQELHTTDTEEHHWDAHEDRQRLIQKIKERAEDRRRADGFVVSQETVLAREGLVKDASQPPEDGQFSPEGFKLASAAEIERPRSALHSGDFREGSPHGRAELQTPTRSLMRSDTNTFSTSPPLSWLQFDRTDVFAKTLPKDIRQGVSPPEQAPFKRARAPSLSSQYSSLVLKAPTSPLVHQANNLDLDFSLKDEFLGTPVGISKDNRRQTLPPNAFESFTAASHGHGPPSLPSSQSMSSAGRDGAFPYRSHQSRRSVSSLYSLQPASSPQLPFLSRSRRPSHSSDVSHSMHHASLVGSYEESILRGRMSTTPSKPLNFMAQIGVLGKGDCKPSLRCPAHVQIPFPAVFYSYPSTSSGRSLSDDTPSPYVGLIDLEDSLRPADQKNPRRKRANRSPTTQARQAIQDGSKDTPSTVKRSNLSRGLRAPPGGCYRIPQQGQLQIVIKNPNKTAVKLFLIPYDLSDMDPGTKTFIRQRSYSVGPVIDMPTSARRNMGIDRSEAALGVYEDPMDKPVLRYLIHVNICSPSKGRFYLFSSIRVVFANRVPDGKEKLRNEVQLPEPKYSHYKPPREGHHIGTCTTERTAAGKQHRRRSAAISPPIEAHSPSGIVSPIQHPIPFHLPGRAWQAPAPHLEAVTAGAAVNVTQSHSPPAFPATDGPIGSGTGSELDAKQFFSALARDSTNTSDPTNVASMGFTRRTVDGPAEQQLSLLARKLRELDGDVEMIDTTNQQA